MSVLKESQVSCFVWRWICAERLRGDEIIWWVSRNNPAKPTQHSNYLTHLPTSDWVRWFCRPINQAPLSLGCLKVEQGSQSLPVPPEVGRRYYFKRLRAGGVAQWSAMLAWLWETLGFRDKVKQTARTWDCQRDCKCRRCLPRMCKDSDSATSIADTMTATRRNKKQDWEGWWRNGLIKHLNYGTGERAQRAESLIPGTHRKAKRETTPHNVVLWSPHVHECPVTHITNPHTQ